MKRLTNYKLKLNQFIPLHIDMKTGQVIDYLIRLKGIKICWSSIISSYDPPHSFVDEQIKGPFTNWVHSHSFKEKNGGTIIIDHVKYSIPFGLIGRIANNIFVEKDLVDIFDYREKTIMEIFNNHYDLCLEI